MTDDSKYVNQIDYYSRRYYLPHIVAGMLAMIVSMGIGRFSFTPMLPIMQQAVHFGDDIAGQLAGANYLGYLLGAIACPFLSGARQKSIFYRVCLLLVVASLLLLPLFDGFSAWAGLRFITGFASAGIFILVSSGVLNLLVSLNKAALFGVMYSGMGLGIVVSTLIIIVSATHYEWQGIWTILSLLGLLLVLPALFYGLPSIPAPAAAMSQHAAKRAPFPLLTLSWAYFLEGLGYSVVATFLVRSVSLTEGLQSMANFSWVIVGAAGIPSTILWSRFAARQGLSKAIMLAFILQGVGMMLPLIWVSGWAIIIGAMTFGGTFIAIVNMTLALGREINPGQSQQIISKLTVLFGLGQIIGPVVAGFIAERNQNFTLALFLSALVIFIGALLVYWGRGKEGVVDNGATV